MFICKKESRSGTYIAPFASVIALATNEMGLFYDLWDILPKENESLNCLPLDLGIYPVFTSLFIHFVQRKVLSSWLLLLIVSLYTTGLEMITVLIGKLFITMAGTLCGHFRRICSRI